MASLPKRLAAEVLGTAFLLAIIVGSGIMGERLANGNLALALLANSLATGAGLTVLILAFGPISGAHFNPVVSLSAAIQKDLSWYETAGYFASQLIGAFLGVATAHLMFGEALFSVSTHVRSGPAQWGSEFVATFGLLSVLAGCSRARPASTPFAVGAYIAAAYWFTASTSFANPAVTLARAASNSFTGIRPVDVSAFVLVQAVGAVTATFLFIWFYQQPRAFSGKR